MGKTDRLHICESDNSTPAIGRNDKARKAARIRERSETRRLVGGGLPSPPACTSATPAPRARDFARAQPLAPNSVCAAPAYCRRRAPPRATPSAETPCSRYARVASELTPSENRG